MLTVEEAQARVLEEVPPLERENVPLAEAHGRVLRDDVRAMADVPERDNSAMDGYAVRAEDIANAPVWLRVIGDLPAGTMPSTTLTTGTAIRIMTGAFVPDGADTVVHVEITDGGSEVVRIDHPLTLGTNVRRRGEDMRAGNVVLHAGSVIRAGELGVLASVQQTTVTVSRRPIIAILSTGDELIDVETPRVSGKIVNANSWSLAALAAEAGAIPRRLGIVPDTREATIAALEKALACDFVVTSGGVSVGAWDFVKDALDALGAELKFWRVAMKPGKPVVLSTLRGRLVFGLPGNPVSCMVSFHLFVAPAIRKALGQSGVLTPPVVRMPMREDLASKGDRRTYMRVRVTAEGGALVAYPMRAQGSGVSTSMIGANGLAVVAEGVTRVEAGTLVDVILVGQVVTA
jgi:molybdopterin molybdotransferase